MSEQAWKPLGSAPLDGTEVLLFGFGHKHWMTVGRWGGRTWCDDVGELWGPTHWMPLPAPPAP